MKFYIVLLTSEIVCCLDFLFQLQSSQHTESSNMAGPVPFNIGPANILTVSLCMTGKMCRRGRFDSYYYWPLAHIWCFPADSRQTAGQETGNTLSVGQTKTDGQDGHSVITRTIRWQQEAVWVWVKADERWPECCWLSLLHIWAQGRRGVRYNIEPTVTVEHFIS